MTLGAPNENGYRRMPWLPPSFAITQDEESPPSMNMLPNVTLSELVRLLSLEDLPVE